MNRKYVVPIFALIVVLLTVFFNIQYRIDQKQLATEEVNRIEYYVETDNFVALNDMTIESVYYRSKLNYVLNSCREYAMADFMGQSETNYSADLVGMVYKVCVDAIAKLKGQLN